MTKPNAAKPCTVQIMRLSSFGSHEWIDAGRFPSVRQARERLADAAYPHVDRLSRCSYDLRIVRADGTVRPLTNAKQDHAVAVAKHWQYQNSIGYRLQCGHAVAV